ncbi:alpha/beta fold hydrolase [Altererythrobacter salegens]|uniref:Alpha/beta fold hydrolase n=1 Tax=Croceibacterium salegens TaxID=1737568 RepID=A0A6I4T241_9SPHN|nr:alpha/beta hydrolase [Croceibacterium salegens]MXO61297.1 alpha/beta fold hydrolase [Croceibacterium salegens]
MNKRDFLKLSGGAMAAGAILGSAQVQAQTCPAPEGQSKTFVLVPGAWCGGFVYDDVAAILRAGGHTVYTPTLSGLGERVHLLDDKLNLTTHIDDIVNVIRYNQLENVVLAGHSYGGMPITGAADKVSDRITSLVYLDALVPGDGDSILSLMGVPPGSPAPVDAEGNPILAFPMPAQMFKSFGLAEDQRWRYTEMPNGPGSEPLHLTGAVDSIAKKSYLWMRSSADFEAIHDQFKDAPGWHVEAWDGGHMMMIDVPEQTADFLVRVA